MPRASTSRSADQDWTVEPHARAGGPGGTKTMGKERKKGRSSVACMSCRARKLACDLKAPCGTCLSKGEEANCSLANSLFYENPSDMPANKLRLLIDRLESKVHQTLAFAGGASTSSSSRTTSLYTISSQPSIHDSPSPPSSLGKSRNGSPAFSTTSHRPKHIKRGSGHSTYSVQSLRSTKSNKLGVVHDAEVLSRLILGVEVGNHFSPGVDWAGITLDLYQISTPTPPSLPALASPISLSLTSQNLTQDSFTQLLRIIPTRTQALLTSSIFFARCDTFHVLHRQTFEAEIQYLFSPPPPAQPLTRSIPMPTSSYSSVPQSRAPTGSQSDPQWLATFLAVCGLGLLAMDDQESSEGDVPPGREGRDLLARSWLDAATKFLAFGDFARSPKLEGIRAVVLLNQFWTTWNSAYHLEAAVTFNTLIISAAFELELHRDSDELETGLSPLASELRRRVFWGLVSHDILTRAVLGKTYSPIDLSLISTLPPSHLPDEAYLPTGDFSFSFTPTSTSNTMGMVGVMHSICVVIGRMGKLLNGRWGASEEELAGLHEELQIIEAGMPAFVSSTGEEGVGEESIMSRILLSYAFLRLHRSCLGSSMLKDTSEEAVWHRDVCLEHCNILMNTGDTLQVLQNHTFHFFSSLFIGSAAITLAIDLLDSPFHPSMDPTRIQLSQLISNLEQKGWENKLDCRLATILRHLINGESTGADVNFLGASETASITSGGSSYHGPPQAPFLSHSRNNSGSSGDWGLDIGMLGSPDGYLMPPQLPFVPRASSEYSSQYSPTAESFEHNSSYFNPDHSIPPSPFPTLGPNSSHNTSDLLVTDSRAHPLSQLARIETMEQREEGGLVKPWLASTQLEQWGHDFSPATARSFQDLFA